MKKIISFCLTIVMCLSFSACKKTSTKTDIWTEATYTEDTEFGKGEKTIFAEIIAEDNSVTFTIHTDKATLGEALVEHDLIKGEEGPYGLYVKKVNGIVADYDKNQAYWVFSKDGESMLTGVDGQKIKDGEHYEIVYTK